MVNFRRHHLLKILDSYDQSSLPIDALLRYYFREHKAVGSKDRKEICDKLYRLIRFKGRLDAHIPKPITWEKRLDALDLGDMETFTDEPDHIQVSFPKTLFDMLVADYGREQALAICTISNIEAPTTVRANLIKTTRESLYQKWKNLYSISIDPQVGTALQFQKKINFFALPEFKDGLFEVQDAGSQMIASLVAAKEGDHILDFCAGSGGKTLAFAPNMKGKGQIYLYDIRPHALLEAKKRLKRAGVQNAQILSDEKLKKKNLLKKMDWILLDVPCSGSGTWRRNPDLKWRFEGESFEKLIETQRSIVKRALPFLKEGGHIVYATCSLFSRENEKQIAYFEEHYNLVLASENFKSLPTVGGMDGFFGAVLKLKP